MKNNNPVQYTKTNDNNKNKPIEHSLKYLFTTLSSNKTNDIADTRLNKYIKKPVCNSLPVINLYGIKNNIDGTTPKYE